MENSLRLNRQNQNSLRVWNLLGSSGGGEVVNTLSVSISSTVSPSVIYEKGTVLSDVVIKTKVTPLKPTEYPVTSAKLYKDGNVVQAFTPSSSATTYEYTTDITDSCVFKGEAKTAKQTATAQLKYTFVDPMFYGMNATTPTAAEILTMTKLIKAKGKVTCPYNSGDNLTRACFAYPKSYGSLTSIQDDMKYEYIMAFEQTEVDLTLHGETVTYYLYTMIDESMLDLNYTFIF